MGTDWGSNCPAGTSPSREGTTENGNRFEIAIAIGIAIAIETDKARDKARDEASNA